MASEPHSAPDDWDAHWERYATSAVQNPAQRMRHEIIARLLSRNPANVPARILDLGSGQGDLAQKLDTLLPDAQLFGAEISEHGVEISKRKVPRATFIVADIFQPPPALERYAGWATHAVCCEVLEHVDDPVAFLRKARHYLAENATLIVTVPGGPISAFDRHIGHRQHFDRRKIRALLGRAGYSVEHIYLAGFPFFNLYRLLVTARGKRLVRDAERQSGGASSVLTNYAMKLFRLLFHGNLRDSPFGWQIVAVASKAGP